MTSADEWSQNAWKELGTPRDLALVERRALEEIARLLLADGWRLVTSDTLTMAGYFVARVIQKDLVLLDRFVCDPEGVVRIAWSRIRCEH